MSAVEERVTRRRGTSRAVAVGLAAALATTAGLIAGGSAAAADTPVSQARGRFLSGTAAGTSFDSVAALNGESATYPDNPGPNQNDLSGSLLGQSLASPFGNASIPFPGGVTFGAVGQYAKANADGSAVGSSGLIGSNGAINVGGSGNDDVATIDLSKLPMASQLTDLLGNLKLTVGAVSARAEQAAFGKTLADPSKGCTGGDYRRVSDADQAGRYQFAKLTLAATSPLLKEFTAQLKTALGTVLTQLKTVPGVGSQLPSVDELFGELSYDKGGISASLTDGGFSIDFAQVLESAGVDLNNLCPNTSLLPYVGKALEGLPDALAALAMTPIDKLSAALPKLPGVDLPTGQLATLITTLKDSFKSLAGNFADPLQQGLNALSDQLLDVVVNAQEESGRTFTETAVQLNLIPNGGSISGLPSLPTPTSSGLPSGNGVTGAIQSLIDALKNSTGGGSTGGGSTGGGSTGGGSTGGGSTGGGVLPTLPAIAPPFAAPLTTTAAGDPVLRLNLASAAVTNDRPASTPTSSAPSSGVAAKADSLPTGVPAGKGQALAAPTVPTSLVVLALLGVVVAGGGTLIMRRRGLRW